MRNNRIIRVVLIILCSLILLTAVGIGGYYSIERIKIAIAINSSSSTTPIAIRASQAYEYAENNKLNTNYALLVDYSIPSGTPRLFVWDFGKNRVIAMAHVMHGSGGGSTDEVPVFSNKIGSKCSSLGHFKVTNEHGWTIKWSYRLQGFDATNSNAYTRGIMIHEARWVDEHLGQKHIPINEYWCQGCITVSYKEMLYLDNLIKKEPNMLLWSYQ